MGQAKNRQGLFSALHRLALFAARHWDSQTSHKREPNERQVPAASGAQPDQRCFLAVVAVKSGALFATQSTNLRTLGLASKASTSVPWRWSSELLKLAISVCWQMGCMGTTSRPPRLLGTGWCQTMVLPVGRPQSQQGTMAGGESSSRSESRYGSCLECLRAMRLSCLSEIALPQAAVRQA